MAHKSELNLKELNSEYIKSEWLINSEQILSEGQQ